MKTLAMVTMAVALALTPATWAQKSDTPPKTAVPSQAAGTEKTLTGCLARQESTFLLRTSSGEFELQGEGLDAHVGKTIRVSGTSSSDPGDKTFKVSEVTVVSPQCQA